MTKPALSKMLDFEADEIIISALEKISRSPAEEQAHGSPRPAQALTLDERSNLYLNAVYGSRDFTSDQYAEAREILLDAMAAHFRAAHESDVPDLSDPSSPVNPHANDSLSSAIQELLQAQAESPRRATLGSHVVASSIPRPPSQASLSMEPLFSVEDGWPKRDYRASMIASPLRKEGRSRRTRLSYYSAVAATVSLILTSSVILYVLLPDSKQHNTFADLSSEQLNSVLSQHGVYDATSFKSNANGSGTAQRLFDLGNRLIASGDLYGGRIALVEAADNGSGSAALNLGSSFDPSEDGSLGRPSDPEKAKFWYLRAKQLGEPEAQARLDRLNSLVAPR